jgi:hypothetical protein
VISEISQRLSCRCTKRGDPDHNIRIPRDSNASDLYPVNEIAGQSGSVTMENPPLSRGFGGWVLHQKAAGAGELIRLLRKHPDGELLAGKVGVGQLKGVPLITEQIWSLRGAAAGGQSDGDGRDPVLYSGIACGVERQEVSPSRRPDDRGARASRYFGWARRCARRRWVRCGARYQGTSSGAASSSSLTARRRPEASDADPSAK